MDHHKRQELESALHDLKVELYTLRMKHREIEEPIIQRIVELNALLPAKPLLLPLTEVPKSLIPKVPEELLGKLQNP